MRRVSNLCHRCKNDFEEQPWLKGTTTKLLKDVENSAQEGCTFCHLVSSCIVAHHRVGLPKETSTVEILSAPLGEDQEGNYHFAIYITIRFQELSSDGSTFCPGNFEIPEFFTGVVRRTISRATVTDLPSDLYTIRGSGPTTDSDSTNQLITNWIKTCVQYHSRCGQHRNSQQNSFLPTRLVSVGAIDTHDLKLCLGRDVSSERRYMTLSHCWGQNFTQILTTESVDRLLRGFPLHELPKTFQDAVRTCRRLGVAYLWIDNLCIIQNSPDDWAQESAAMADIYMNAWCNISATNANNAHGGCFNSRNPLDAMPCFINAFWTDKNHPTGIRVPLECYSTRLWHENIESKKLMTRGWVIQERLLSPRILHFAQKQVFWECLESRACEQFPEKIILFSLQSEPGKPSIQIPASDSQSHDGEQAEDTEVSSWHALVGRYSKCDLTDPKDKLVALSGIARMLGAPETYLAGLWKDRVHLDLLWRCADAETVTARPFSRPDVYRAPSWSWASVDGPLEFILTQEDDDDYIKLIELDEARIVSKTADAFGELLIGCSLELEGSLFPLTLAKEQLNEVAGTYSAVWLMNDTVGIHIDTPQPSPSGEEVFCLPVCSLPISLGQYGSGEVLVRGLVLKALENGVGEYQRFGTYCVYGDEGPAPGLTAAHSFVNCTGVWEPRRYEEYLGIGKYGEHRYKLTIY